MELTISLKVKLESSKNWRVLLSVDLKSKNIHWKVLSEVEKSKRDFFNDKKGQASIETFQIHIRRNPCFEPHVTHEILIRKF